MELLGSFLPALNALLQHRGIDTQKPYWNPGDGFAHNRVSILKGGYRYSIRVSVLKNHSGILECFKNVTGYNKIAIAPEDQEKTTFTCPYGTYAFQRMPFGLCNAPATFQRCMLAIFSDMVEEFLEVFMDDFSVSG
ncbi:hypothetical protein V6N13_114096 [Hibiscus sabdariffa]